MAVKFRISRKSLVVRFLMNPWGRAFLLAFTISATLGVGVFTYYYVKYARIIEDKLKNGPFANTSILYASPRPVMLGDRTQPGEIADYLRRAGFSEASTNRLGWYHVRPGAIEINPGPDAYDSEGAVVKIAANRVTEIISLRDHTNRMQYDLEPEVITNLFDQKREKRRLVHFGDIPKVMVNAVLSAEDKHFFQHSGFDPIGILRAAWIDLKERRGSQGASTLTQQLARTLWLGPERGWRRKIPETLITLHLEQQLTKEQIFEDYANAIYLGHQGSFSIHGFGEGAEVYLGKDLTHVTASDAALLAGLIQSPAGRNPFRYPERARARRNLVLKAMRENGYLTQKDYRRRHRCPAQRHTRGGRIERRSVFRRSGGRHAAESFSGLRFPEQFVPRVYHARYEPAARRGGGGAHRHSGNRSAVETPVQEIRHRRDAAGAGGVGGARRRDR